MKKMWVFHVFFYQRGWVLVGGRLCQEGDCLGQSLWCPRIHGISIYMITSVPCRPSVAGCPGARHSVPVDLTRHKGRSRV